MKKILLLTLGCLIFIFFSIVFVYSQENIPNAKIIFLKGKVFVKSPTDTTWIQASREMSLPKGTTIKTGKDSSCEIAFDRDYKNVIGLEQNTIVSVDNLYPTKVSLPKGRVFSLISNLEKEATFEIRTPIAIGGARGTGWLTESKGKSSTFKQHEGSIYVSGIDKDGNPIGEINLLENFSVIVDFLKAPGQLIKLTEKDLEQWNSWKQNMQAHADQARQESAEAGGSSTSLAKAIQSELSDVFDTESGFAADGADFVDNNLPSMPEGADVVSSGDITLVQGGSTQNGGNEGQNEEPPLPPPPPPPPGGGGGGGGGCFLAGTLITMADGTQKPIEEIQVNDIVIAFNEGTSQMESDIVIHVFSHPKEDVYLIINKKLKVTPVHLVLSKGQWRKMGDLRIGDTLTNAKGEDVTIFDIAEVHESVNIYNFETNPLHTYIADGFIAHNRKAIVREIERGNQY